ncbi:MAG: cytochrome b/b6 domain-containing protein [Rhodospirillales bacterium]|jgi:cytochrome b|nr:cytochrome b/b6 domain-containing protein [Rhodospirillales bacterium]
MKAAPGTRRVLVWDLPVRLFHWLLAPLVLVLWVTERWNRMGWHVLAGEVLLGLVLFRLFWGFVGSETARFARFLATPAAAWRHLRRSFAREPDHAVGHNPAGGWMVALLLLLLLAECLSGVFVNNDVADQGPFTDHTPAWFMNLVTDLHAILFQAIVAAVGLHLAAIAVYAAAKGQNLLRPMVTGWKQLPATRRPPQIAGVRRALLLAVLAAALAAGWSWFS